MSIGRNYNSDEWRDDKRKEIITGERNVIALHFIVRGKLNSDLTKNVNIPILEERSKVKDDEEQSCNVFVFIFRVERQ